MKLMKTLIIKKEYGKFKYSCTSSDSMFCLFVFLSLPSSL